MTSLWFQSLLLPVGWAERVRLEIAQGRIQAIKTGVAPDPDAECHAIGLPGMPNVHSHAFQRGMAGLTETRGATADSFWTWRETMYQFIENISRDDLEAISAFAYLEMLESGFIRVGEFHYIHHDRGGREFCNLAEMAGAIAGAAQQTGIGLVLLPVFYAYNGFGGIPPLPHQARFITDVDRFAQLLEACRRVVAPLDDAAVGVAPHSLRAVTETELRVLISMADDGPMHIHIAEQRKEVEDCLSWCGRRPVTWLMDNVNVNHRWCLVHATHIDDNELTRIAASGATVGLCPITESNLGDGTFPATAYLAAGGSYGVGSDSNILIDVAQELRTLEYSQRLAQLARNLLSLGDGRSTGRSLFDYALEGASRALGMSSAGLSVGAPADLISLDGSHDALSDRTGDALIDSWVFAARSPAVDCVWRYGRKVVSGGRHRDRDAIRARYHAALKRLQSV